MFEKDNRKATREKRSTEIHSPRKSKENKGEEESNTVYGELKLSEKLSLEMINLRKEKESMIERIEQLQVDYLNMQKKQRSSDITVSVNKGKLRDCKAVIETITR